MDVTIKECTENHVLATWERAVFIIWRQITTMQGVQKGGIVARDYALELGTKILLVNVIEANAALPTLSVRNEIVRNLKKYQEYISRSVLIVDGEGFRASSVRTVISGILLFTAPLYPTKVFSETGGAARFLLSGDQSIPPHILMRALEQARKWKL